MAPGTPGDQIYPSSHCVSSAVLQSSFAGVFLSCEPLLGKRKLKTLDALCPHRSHWMCLGQEQFTFTFPWCFKRWKNPVWVLKLIIWLEQRSPSGNVLRLHIWSQNPPHLLQLLTCHSHTCCNYWLFYVTPGKSIIDFLLVLMEFSSRREVQQMLHHQLVPTDKHQVVLKP